MKWCCPQFEWRFQEAGHRGFAVFAAFAEGVPSGMFLFQHRAIDDDKEPPKGYKAPLTLISDVGILFCPWCGVRLADFYAGVINELDRSDLRVSI